MFFFQKHFRSVKCKGLPVRDDANNSEQATTALKKKNYRISSEPFASVTYVFHFWIRGQSEGITFTIQFFQVQLDWSRRNLSLPIEHLFWIHLRQSAKWLSLVLCTSAWPSLCASVLAFILIFKVIVFSNSSSSSRSSSSSSSSSITCKVKRWRKLEIVAVLFS